jgi:hypothetical protein
MKQTARILVLIVTFCSALLCADRAALSQSNRVSGQPINWGPVQQPEEDDSTASNSNPNQQSNATAAPSHSMFLQAGISHAEHLAPVQGMQVGTKFNESTALDATAPKQRWFRVPPWLAGKWEEDSYTQTYYQNYQTGAIDRNQYTHNAQTTEVWGLQRDSAGGIWDVINLPHVGTTTSDKWVYKDLHTDDSTVFDSDIKVISRLFATRTTINRATNLIKSVHQNECFSTFTMAGPEMVRTDYSMKTFDQQGNPLNLREGFRVAHKSQPFQPNNFLNGKDVRPSFQRYLTDHGMANLVPSDSAN